MLSVLVKSFILLLFRVQKRNRFVDYFEFVNFAKRLLEPFGKKRHGLETGTEISLNLFTLGKDSDGGSVMAPAGACEGWASQEHGNLYVEPTFHDEEKI